MICRCAAYLNEKLAHKNTKLAGAFSFYDGKMEHQQFIIATETTTPGKRRTKPPLVLANYCPFCGVQLERGE